MFCNRGALLRLRFFHCFSNCNANTSNRSSSESHGFLELALEKLERLCSLKRWLSAVNISTGLSQLWFELGTRDLLCCRHDGRRGSAAGFGRCGRVGTRHSCAGNSWDCWNGFSNSLGLNLATLGHFFLHGGRCHGSCCRDCRLWRLYCALRNHTASESTDRAWGTDRGRRDGRKCSRHPFDLWGRWLDLLLLSLSGGESSNS
jgi:hypothetical protein